MSGNALSKLFFYTSSSKKIEETKLILGIDIEKKIPVSEFIEIQSSSIDVVIKDKARKAFQFCENKPVLVEHTGLYLDYLNGLPGAMTQPYLAKLELSKICDIVQKNRKATVKTCIGFSNGHHEFYWTAETKGEIACSPVGRYGFGWDQIFIPDGQKNQTKKTFAEMDILEKNSYSMRKKALEKLKHFVGEKGKLSIQEFINMTAEKSAKLYFVYVKEKNNNQYYFKPFFVNELFEKNNYLILRNKNSNKKIFGIDSKIIKSLTIMESPKLEEKEKTLQNSYFLKIDSPINYEKAKKLECKIIPHEDYQYFTYGDSILKILRNDIITKAQIENEDSLYIIRASNAKYFDEILKARTAYGEALYYNPVEMASPIEYVYNANEKNKADNKINAVFRNYVLPDIASIWVYDNKSTYSFAKKKGGYYFVPLISLAEIAAYLIRTKIKFNKINFANFFGNHLAKYTENDIKNNWAYKSFDFFPHKNEVAELHISIIKHLLNKHGHYNQIKVLDRTQNISDIINVLNTYKDILVEESQEPKKFHEEIKSITKKNKVKLTELVIIKPGLKSNKFQIPYTPTASCVFFQGNIEYKYYEFKKDINQILYSHNWARPIIDLSTTIFTILDYRDMPLINMKKYENMSDMERKRRIYIESVMFRIFTLLHLKTVSLNTKLKIIESWNEVI